MRHIFLFLFGVIQSLNCMAQQSLFAAGKDAFDPFKNIFNNEFNRSNLREQSGKDLGRMNSYINNSQKLTELCTQEISIKYTGIEDLETAQRTFASTLQWTMLNHLIPVIGETARLLGMNEDDFSELIDGLLNGSCSKNYTLMSFKRIRALFLKAYASADQLPRIKKSLFYPSYMVDKAALSTTLERHLALFLRSFRAGCSWGGDVLDFRMLTTYLKDPLIAVDSILKLSGKKIDEHGKLIDAGNAKRVTCTDTICREASVEIFNGQFPRAIGSIGIEQDMQNLYCQYFSDLRYKMKDQEPLIKSWVKEIDSIDEHLEILNFQSLIHGFPFLLLSAGSYREFLNNLKQVVEINWNYWANQSVDNVETELMYEESVHLDFLAPSKDADAIKDGIFSVHGNIVLGEFDRSFGMTDKITTTIPLNFSKEFIQWVALELSMTHQISSLKQRRDQAMLLIQQSLASDLARGLSELKLPWGADKISILVAENLAAKLQKWADDGLQGKNWIEIKGRVRIPLHLHYGLFTLQLMRDRFQHNRAR